MFRKNLKIEKLRFVLNTELVKSDPVSGEDVFTISHFHSDTHVNLEGSDEREIFDKAIDKMLEQLENYKIGKLWVFNKVVSRYNFFQMKMN